MRCTKIVPALLLTLLFVYQPAFSVPLRMIGVGDPILEDYTFLIRSSEESVLSVTPPFTSEEMLVQVRNLSTANRSPAWRDTYARLMQTLSANPILKDGAFGITVHPELAVEGRWRSNSNLDWIREEKQNSALLTFPLEFFFANSLYARGDLIIRNDPSFYNDDKPYGTNLPLDVQKLDANMPLKAFISAGGPWWSFQLGRDRLSFGNGRGGNLAISDTPDYYDFARLSLFSPNFKYSLLVTQLPLETPSYFYSEGFQPSQTDPPLLKDTTQRYLYMHRWDLRLWKKLSIGVSEGVMVGNSPLELRFLNPLTVYHSFFSWNDYPRWGTDGDMTGSIVSLDVEWAMGGGISLYGQAVMNQFATPYELEHWPDDNSPNGLGWLGGVEYNSDIAGWRSLFYFEAVYTDPYLYVLSSPFASFIWMRRLSELKSKQLRYTWIGYPEGRDCIELTLGSKMFKSPISLSWALSYLDRGEHTIQWDWKKGSAAVQERTPSGTAEQNWSIATELGWQVIKPLRLTFFGALQWVQNVAHQSGTTAFSTEFAVSAHYIF
ncbi:MAG: capsule assembly Wzi family protein [Treponema sp.]|nr:capsule assembly Wzi family protein [Treponema sp.]